MIHVSAPELEVGTKSEDAVTVEGGCVSVAAPACCTGNSESPPVCQEDCFAWAHSIEEGLHSSERVPPHTFDGLLSDPDASGVTQDGCCRVPASPAQGFNKGTWSKRQRKELKARKALNCFREEDDEKTCSFWLEFLNDSGAGRTIWSIPELVKQGVPKSILHFLCSKSSEQIDFYCGGGKIDASISIMMCSPTVGLTEAYRLPKGPFAVSMGRTVKDNSMPFIWVPNDLPYHVTDMSKLQVWCPMRYRDYAHRVEQNVPIWNQRMRRMYASASTTWFQPMRHVCGISLPEPHKKCAPGV